MAVTYKDINLLTQKSPIAGTEKLPVSDTQFITPSQIAAIVQVDSSLSSSSTNAIQNQAVDAEFDKVVYIGSEGEAIEDIPDAPDTSDCVHITGDETVGGDKTFTDNIAVVDASHILYSGASPSQGFTRGVKDEIWTPDTEETISSIVVQNLEGEPKAFVLTSYAYSSGVLMIIGDASGLHGIYNTGSQHNYSASFTKSYSNGTLTLTAPNGISFIPDDIYLLVYYYGNGTLTFKTSTFAPGSGVTSGTFTGTGLTEIPAMYACFLETAVNNEQYRRVAGYTNSSANQGTLASRGITFLTGGPTDTTSSFTVSYNNGLVINSGGTNAGGYFHNPGTYTLYYLMASDVASGGGGGYSSLADELAAINDAIGDVETLLAAI